MQDAAGAWCVSLGVVTRFLKIHPGSEDPFVLVEMADNLDEVESGRFTKTKPSRSRVDEMTRIDDGRRQRRRSIWGPRSASWQPGSGPSGFSGLLVVYWLLSQGVQG